ncbi:MAG: hypothetical protein ABIP54_02015 [Candidatus Andersenbacteria bacterium]
MIEENKAKIFLPVHFSDGMVTQLKFAYMYIQIIHPFWKRIDLSFEKMNGIDDVTIHYEFEDFSNNTFTLRKLFEEIAEPDKKIKRAIIEAPENGGKLQKDRCWLFGWLQK